jgi:outer membrane immunogenic protein
MNRIILSGVAFVALIATSMNSANAADMPIEVAKAPLPPPIYNWSGFYFGIHGGGGWGRTQGSNEFLGNLIDQKTQGWLAGAQIGANYQFGRIVIGVELSGSWDDVNGTSDCFVDHSNLAPGTTVNCDIKQKWSTQLLARFGYAPGDGRFLPYILGGVALTEFNTAMQVTGSVLGAPFSVGPWGASRQHQGAVVGIGAQYAVRYGLSVGLEYLYTVYDTQEHSSRAAVTGVGIGSATLITPLNLTTHTARLVLNYKFD